MSDMGSLSGVVLVLGNESTPQAHRHMALPQFVAWKWRQVYNVERENVKHISCPEKPKIQKINIVMENLVEIQQASSEFQVLWDWKHLTPGVVH